MRHGGEWRTGTQWPPASTAPVSLYLTTEPVMAGGAYDQNAPGTRVFGASEPYLPLDSRPDVISLTTQPLERDVVLAGPVSARLYISTTAPDADFTIKMIDVHPPNGADALAQAG